MHIFELEVVLVEWEEGKYYLDFFTRMINS